MKHIDKTFKILAVISLIIFAVLAYYLSTSRIVLLQGYIDFTIPTLFFWIAVFLLSYVWIRKEIGYLKMVMFLLLVYSSLSLILFAVRDDTRYEVYSSEDHSVIIKLTTDEIREYITIYNQENTILYKEVFQTRYSEHFDVTYRIDGDYFIIEKCNDGFCSDIEVDIK